MRGVKFLQCNWLYIAILILGAIYVVIGFTAMPNPKQDDYQLGKVHFEGMLSVDDGEWIDYHGAEQLDGVKSSHMDFQGHFTGGIEEGVEVLFKLDNLECQIYVNDELIFNNDFTESDLWVSFISAGITEEDDVRIALGSTDADISNAMFHAMKYMCTGDKYILLHQKMLQYAFSIGVSALILIFGIAVLVVAFTLWLLKVENVKEYIVCGMLAVSGAMCCLINYDYIQLIFPKIYGIQSLDYFSQAIVSTSLLVYLGCYIEKKVFSIVSRWISYIWVVAIIINFVVAYFAGRKTPVIYGKMISILATMVVINLFFIIYEYFRTENKDIQGVLIGSSALALCTIAEVIHFLIYDWWIFAFLQFGLVFFVTMQLMILVNISRKGLEQAVRVKEMEKELMQASIHVMISQIQPHFLYNTLGTIRALIQIDPDKASDVVDYFSKYLRANMQSLTNQSVIPFEQELEHVKNYLYIELVRFEDKLTVEYDLEAMDFDCPALMLQTTVENAVKHGIGNKRGGGTVWIRSREEKNNIIIEVEDDGVGFDVTRPMEDGRTHVGIENSRNRLKGMCNGEYEVVSEIGVGTKVIIIIPKKMEE